MSGLSKRNLSWFFIVYFQVISEELFRNMALALMAVFIVTLIVLANIWVCLLVFTCVGFTLVSGL